MKKINKGGRRKLDEPRKHQIKARFTSKELELVKRKEQAYNMSRTDLIRLAILDGIEPSLINAKEVSTELKNIGTQIAYIGNNINQIARHMNSLNKINAINDSSVNQFNVFFGEYNELTRQLDTVLRSAIRYTKLK